MSRATEDQLAQLHNKVAQHMTETLSQADTAYALLDEHNDLPDNVQEFLEQCTEVSPSLLTAAIKFLKDNDITCSPEESKDLQDLQDQLRKKRATVTKIPIE